MYSAFVLLCLAGQELKVIGEQTNSTRRLFPIKVLVRSVVSVLWKTQAEKNNGPLEVFLHCHDSADGAALANKRRLLAERSEGRGPSGVGKTPVYWAEIWP